jgi:CrcB protein
MAKIVYIGLGGFVGASLRYLIGGWVHRLIDKPWLPYGTFAVNMLGCFFIGLIIGLSESRQFLTPEMRLFIVTGLLGSLTTFSTYALESFNLFRDGEIAASLVNVGIHVVVGLVCVALGMMLSRAI